eukprot:GHVR01171375.1.p1 GENE.GHVR01171375.1~~GHVR01171375.1.p1  ORF type:complete len:175 (-),score=43.30 GHVR01171375.1:143-667(-)
MMTHTHTHTLSKDVSTGESVEPNGWELLDEFESVLAAQLNFQRFLWEKKIERALRLHNSAVSSFHTTIDTARRENETLHSEVVQFEKNIRNLQKKLILKHKKTASIVMETDFQKEINKVLFFNIRKLKGDLSTHDNAGKVLNDASHALQRRESELDATIITLHKRLDMYMKHLS